MNLVSYFKRGIIIPHCKQNGLHKLGSPKIGHLHDYFMI